MTEVKRIKIFHFTGSTLVEVKPVKMKSLSIECANYNASIEQERVVTRIFMRRYTYSIQMLYNVAGYFKIFKYIFLIAIKDNTFPKT
ncbi:hypothetical protein SAMN05428988_0510 [Chitinophaga sp. YR573]|nr:hypothetical protein SAMN05428988_0510 [Chitinophaga sp. YR573]